MTNIKIALIGDYSAKVTAHQAIPLALRHAARICETPLEEEWIGTDTIQTDYESPRYHKEMEIRDGQAHWDCSM